MWPDAEQTQNLVADAARNHPGAVDRLLLFHREPLRRVIAARLDPRVAKRVDPSDVMQCVLLEASRRLADYLRQPVVPFHVWLRQIACDELIDVHRRHRVAARRSVDREQPMPSEAFGDRSSIDLAAALRDPGLTPAADAIRRELTARFTATLSEMDDDDREVLLLRHTDSLSNSEIARALGLSEAAAGMRYLRALRRLRNLLGSDLSRDQSL